MQKIIGVKKYNDKNLYYFSSNADLNIGDKVVVGFDDFLTIATVTRLDVEISSDEEKPLREIIRVAKDADIKKYNEFQAKAKSNLKIIKSKSLELGLFMKFVSAEYSLDNSKIIITFSSEERVDFRQFLKDLASILKIRIELKQIGQRDEVKVTGGVGPCGEPCCCARFLNEFEHVTVKMAKIQGLSLSPTKINGICGRLMCCLGYESETYEEILKKMPKINSEVKTPNGKGVVVYNDILRERVSVKRQSENDTFVVEDFALDEINGEGQANNDNKGQSQSNFKKEKDFTSDKTLKLNEEKCFENLEINNENKDATVESDKPNVHNEREGFKYNKKHIKNKNKNFAKAYNNKK